MNHLKLPYKEGDRVEHRTRGLGTIICNERVYPYVWWHVKLDNFVLEFEDEVVDTDTVILNEGNLKPASYWGNEKSKVEI